MVKLFNFSYVIKNMILKIEYFFLALILALLSSCKNDQPEPKISTPVAASATKWIGPDTTITKASGADPSDVQNQDRITDNVWLTRGNNGGQLYNAKVQNFSDKFSSPKGTLWAEGDISNIDNLDFKTFREAVVKPKNAVGKKYVVFLEQDTIYLSLTIKAWSNRKSGGFSYSRSTE